MKYQTFTQPELDRVKKSGYFDEDWYVRTYPDVSALDMDPASHYMRYGHVMGRNPSKNFSTSFFRNLYMIRNDVDPISWMEWKKRKNELPSDTHTRALVAASRVNSFEYDQAISLAESYINDDTRYAIDILRANQALMRKDPDGWLTFLNRFLQKKNTDQIQLSNACGTIFDRIYCKTDHEIKNGPLVSVIMTAYNSEQTILRSIQSILNQTWRNVELIIIDDHSEDSTWSIIQEIANTDRRIQAFRNSVNIGTFASKNIATSRAKGEWVTCQDADDWSHPSRIEKHIDAINASEDRPLASNIMMLRMRDNGYVDRLAPISNHSTDGATRDAPISCMFERNFLITTLGGWDPVRFGADSEIDERARLIENCNYTRFDIIGMFCLVSDTGLTNQPDHYIDPTKGPSEKPRKYVAAYREWHEKISKGYESPHIDYCGERKFISPPSFVVPRHDIKRNLHCFNSDLMGDDCEVTAIVVSKRPWLLSHVAQTISQQSLKKFEFIYVAHGEGHDFQKIKQAFSNIDGLKIIADETGEKSLGSLLNEAISVANTEYLAKIDDDDYYGPDYLLRSLATLRFCGHENVGMVGKGRAYCYVEDKDAFAVRFPLRNENVVREHVFGSTLFWSRTKLKDQRFQDLPRAVDSAFIKDALQAGVQVYSGDRFDHVAIRYADVGNHTWNVSSDDFLKPAEVVAEGLRLDIAFSSYSNSGIRHCLPNRP